MQQSQISLGIVLKSEKYKEADVRCHILTPTGIKVATATGALRSGAKLKSAVQLFTIAEFTFTGTRVTGAHILQLGNPIARDINRYYLACSISEILLQLKNTGERIFYLSAKTFEALTETVSAYKIFINFYTKLLVLLGYDVDIPDFKNIDNDKIDEVELKLSDARTYIKMLCESFTEHLDIRIPNVDIF